MNILKNKLMIYCVMMIVLVVALVALLINHEKIELKDYAENAEVVTDAKIKASDKASEKTEDKETSKKSEKVTEETTVDNTLHEVSLVAVGDDLIHDSIVHCGLQDDGTYDFSQLFKDVKDEVSAADIAVINQETILGGPDFAYSGYPNFNSPFEVGEAAIDAGFDIFLQATNHSMDMGSAGIENDIGFYKKHPEVTMIGLNESEEAAKEITVVEKNGIKIAVLNYTYGLNGYHLPEGKEYLVNLYKDYDDNIYEDKLKNDLQKADELADFVIVFPHWGIEYTYEPNEEQKYLANFFVENGADLIIGTHPHVVEGIEWIQSENGNKGLCYYSLGNFTSHQDMVSTMLGGMAKLTIAKQGDKVYIEDGAGVVPLVTHYVWGAGKYTNTYFLKDYDDEKAKGHSINTITSGFSATALNSLASDIFGDWIIE